MRASASVFAVVLFLTKANGDSMEEQHPFTDNNIFPPSTVNFNEIFTNSLSMLNDEPGLTTINKDDEYHLSSLPTQFVEFHPYTTTTTTTTTPKPRFLAAAYLRKDTDLLKEYSTSTSTTSTSTTTMTTTTEKAVDAAMKVLPLNQGERGVLDLIFPAARVRSFKHVFDTVRRMLSSTF